MTEDKKVKELLPHIRSECCLATITVHQVEKQDYSSENLEPPYFVYEPCCDNCGADLDWRDEFGEQDKDGLPQDCYDLSLRKDVNKVAKEMQKLRTRNEILESIVEPMKAVYKRLGKV